MTRFESRTMRTPCRLQAFLAAVLALVLLGPSCVWAEVPNAKMIEMLRPFDGFVGIWKGSGVNPKSSGWNETLEGTWGFRERDGRASLNLYVDGGLMLKQALLTFDPVSEQYRLVIVTPKDKLLRFQGEVTGEQFLTLDRVDEAGDELDRIELKMVRGGHKMIYTFKKKVGSSYYETNGNVELFRESPAQELFEANPRCIVTGGFGRIPVPYKGKTVFVACLATKEEFERRPDHYLDAAKSE